MPRQLTDDQTVATYLQRNLRVIIGKDEPSDANENNLSYQTLSSLREGVEADLELRLSRFYVTPLRLTDVNTLNLIKGVSTKLTAYECYLVMNPSMTTEEIPAVVKLWKDSAESTLAQILPEGQELPVVGKDTILKGEVLIAQASTPGTTAFAVTRTLPYGGAIN